MVGMVRPLIKSRGELLSNPNNEVLTFTQGEHRHVLSNFEIADKGRAYYATFDYSLFATDPKGPAVKKFEFLQCVEFQAKYREIGWDELYSALPELEQKGYIKYVPYSIEELIEGLTSPVLKKNLTIYYKVAKELPVSNNEVEYLFEDLYRRYKYLCRTIDPGEAEDINCQQILKQCSEAVSRSDKVIVIDTMMATTHGMGPVASSLYYKKDRLTDRDKDYHQRILGKLAGE